MKPSIDRNSWPGRVRRAQPTDLDELSCLFEDYRAFYGADRRPTDARAFLFDRMRFNQSFIFVAEPEDGSLVGFVQLFPMFTSVGLRQILVLNDLFVASASRGSGIAALLLDQAKTLGSALGVQALRLSTRIENQAAQRLYSRAGWRKSEEYMMYEIATASVQPGLSG